MGLRCLHTSIFIETPSLEGLPTKAKEDPSPHELRLYPAGHQPSISWSRGKVYYYYYYYYYHWYYYYYYYYIIILLLLLLLSLLSLLLLLFWSGNSDIIHWYHDINGKYLWKVSFRVNLWIEWPFQLKVLIMSSR